MKDIQRTTDSEEEVTEDEIMEVIDSDEVIQTNDLSLSQKDCNSLVLSYGERTMTEAVPVLLASYNNTEEMEVDENGHVANHDELSKTHVVRGMNRKSALNNALDIVTEDRGFWREEFEDIEIGEEYEV